MSIIATTLSLFAVLREWLQSFYHYLRMMNIFKRMRADYLIGMLEASTNLKQQNSILKSCVKSYTCFTHEQLHKLFIMVQFYWTHDESSIVMNEFLGALASTDRTRMRTLCVICDMIMDNPLKPPIFMQAFRRFIMATYASNQDMSNVLLPALQRAVKFDYVNNFMSWFSPFEIASLCDGIDSRSTLEHIKCIEICSQKANITDMGNCILHLRDPILRISELLLALFDSKPRFVCVATIFKYFAECNLRDDRVYLSPNVFNALCETVGGFERPMWMTWYRPI